MTQAVLTVQNLSAGYGNIQVLHGISITVGKGQLVAVLGTNGAGKTSLLRSISGVLPASSGSVHLLGADITKVPAHHLPARGMVHVPEGRHIFGTMTVRENLELGAFTVPDAALRQQRVEAVFQQFPILAERRKQDAGYLSGGQQQMLAIGRALMANPQILLLDEPSMGLAPVMVKEVMQIVNRLKESGVTILLVEQNSKVALKYADYGYVLGMGRIVLQGPGQDLLVDDAVVRTYLGGAVAG